MGDRSRAELVDNGPLQGDGRPEPRTADRPAVPRLGAKPHRLRAAAAPTRCDADGHREILGLQVTSAEDGAGWLGFFRDLTARGLTGVQLVTSDAHRGLVDAIGATLPGAPGSGAAPITRRT